MSFDSSGSAYPPRSWNTTLPHEKPDPNPDGGEEWTNSTAPIPETVTIKVEPLTEAYNPPLPSFHVESLLDSGGVKPEEEVPIEYVAVNERGKKRPGRPKGSKNSKKPVGGNQICDLCLRDCPGNLVEDVGGSERRFEEILGIQVELRSGSVCRTCLKLVEMFGEFKVCCLKAKEWSERRVGSLKGEAVEDGWFSNKTIKGFERTAGIIRGYVNRLTMQEDEDTGEDNDDANSRGNDSETPMDNEPESHEDLTKEPVNFGEDYLKQFLEDSFKKLDESNPGAAPAQKLNITVYTCEKCQRRFDSKIGYCYHTKLCKPDSAIREATLHTCPICSADFTSLWLMRDHLNKHRGVKRFTCRKDCKKTFYTVLARRSHEKHCSSESTICTLCGVVLKSENSLGSHMAYIHGEAKIPCETCGKMFKARKALLKHMTVHSDARNYPCQVCGKAFKSSWTVKVHMRIHTQEKPFQCAICGQGFAYKCILKSHMEQTHGSNH